MLAYQRGIPGRGRDVVVVASLSESTLSGYTIPFRSAGRWFEVFNSDVYDNWVNRARVGNCCSIDVNGPPYNNLSASARIAIRKNAVLLFA